VAMSWPDVLLIIFLVLGALGFWVDHKADR
jgi:hypothetical protein